MPAGLWQTGRLQVCSLPFHYHGYFFYRCTVVQSKQVFWTWIESAPIPKCGGGDDGDEDGEKGKGEGKDDEREDGKGKEDREDGKGDGKGKGGGEEGGKGDGQEGGKGDGKENGNGKGNENDANTAVNVWSNTVLLAAMVTLISLVWILQKV